MASCGLRAARTSMPCRVRHRRICGDSARSGASAAPGRQPQRPVLADVGVCQRPASRYRYSPGTVELLFRGAGPRAALICWATTKSASVTSGGCAGRAEMTQPSGRFQLAITSGGMDASRENPGRCGSRRAGAAAALQLRFVLRCGRAGWDGWRGLPVTPAHLGMRTRHLAWRWGLDLRVAHCCLEHAGQYSGPGARRPGPPGSPPLSHRSSIGGRGEQTAGYRRRRTRAGP